MGDPLKFVPFNSMINPGFWTALAKQKLDVSKRKKNTHSLVCFYPAPTFFLDFVVVSKSHKEGEAYVLYLPC